MRYIDEVRRKTIHLSSALIPAIYAFISTELALAILTPLLAAALLLDLLRLRSAQVRSWVDRRMGNLFRREESRRLSGATYVLLAGVLSIWLFPKRVAIVALFIMSVSDTLASLIGRRYGRTPLLGKSLEGSAAHFASGVVVGILSLPAHPLAAVLGALTATLVEALPLSIGRHHVDDNLAVPLTCGAVMTLLIQDGL
ncbi:MAG: phosphatidate cytidylyltransferase [Phycisphaerae bacterium]|jgi:dolichol kinase